MMRKCARIVRNIATIGTGTAIVSSGMVWACNKVFKPKPVSAPVHCVISEGIRRETQPTSNASLRMGSGRVPTRRKRARRSYRNCDPMMVFEQLFPEMSDLVQLLLVHANQRIMDRNASQRVSFKKETIRILIGVAIPSMLRIVPDVCIQEDSNTYTTAEHIHAEFCHAEKGLVHVRHIFCNSLLGKYGPIMQGNLDPGPARELVDRIDKIVNSILAKMRDQFHNHQMDLTGSIISRSAHRPDPIRRIFYKEKSKNP